MARSICIAHHKLEIGVRRQGEVNASATVRAAAERQATPHVYTVSVFADPGIADPGNVSLAGREPVRVHGRRRIPPAGRYRRERPGGRLTARLKEEARPVRVEE